MLDASATTSFGLLYLLFHWAETSRIQAKSEHCLMYLKKIAVNSMSLISEGGGRCYLDNGEFNFSAAGVCNVFESLQWCHGGIRDSLAASWSEMRENGKLSTEMTHASIIDLVLFLAVVRRHRRQLKKHSWTSRITDVFCQCLWSVVKFLGAFVNHHCRYLQRTVENIEARAIPSRKKKNPIERDAEDDPETYQHNCSRAYSMLLRCHVMLIKV